MFPNDRVGEQIEVMLTLGTYGEVYPGWYLNWIPLEIVAEFPGFFLCEVLPHVNPINKRQGFKGKSKPYKITINKLDIGEKWKVRGLIENG